ncbi:MAG: hypothetical protein JRF30_01035 [Deltaproteobacteria bacterium]|nr:hypothetical protein [Deltaproteobacteria bacterium]MBW1793793.1 hypothetical protein [Deltaproteobacteria bacterium]MBW2329536.1 hypothetical protein [Deltaproteobacteria bacterium]
MNAAERKNILHSIATTIADYREGEIPKPTPSRVNRWVKQFDAEVQDDILLEMDHILKQMYWSKESVIEYLAGMLDTEKLTGDNPGHFWKSVNFGRSGD